MSNSVLIIFGLKELPRPKGDGYLYVSYDGKQDGKPLAYFNFYKTSDDELRKILWSVLSLLPDFNSYHSCRLENFSLSSEVIFHEVFYKLKRERESLGSELSKIS